MGFLQMNNFLYNNMIIFDDVINKNVNILF